MLISGTTKLVILGVLIAAAVSWFGYEKLKSYNAGKKAVIERINKETDKVKQNWEQIDRTNPSLDEALEGLK